MSLPTGAEIYTGPWINWSRGLVLGSTITLTQYGGGLLTAFLGIFVTVAGAACWRILSFMIHQHRARKELQDALHHQQQAILRNSSSPGGAAWQMIQLMWYWRKTADRPILRSLPFLALALCDFLLFTIAGIFVAEVTKAAGDEMLIRSPYCGYLLPEDNRPGLLGFSRSTSLNAMDANDTLDASAYSRACYGTSEGGSQCHRFAESYIPWTNRTDIPCPFGEDICKDVGGFEMRTGLIDSHETLGINSKVSERLQYEKVTTCSILRTKEYSHYINTTSASGVQQLIVYNYDSEISPEDEKNSTFLYNTNDVDGQSGYTLISFLYSAEDSVLIPALKRNDADVTLMFLAQNSASYNSPVLDPWFRATIPEQMGPLEGENFTVYLPDYWIGVLACADQYQLRNPANDISTPLTSFSYLSEEIKKLGLNQAQEALALSLFYTIGYQSTYYSVHTGGGASLRASDTLGGSDSVHPGLPDNQWMIEAAAMFSLSLAKLQQQIVNYATGPKYFHEGLTYVKGNEELCSRQKIRGENGYLSFSVLGVSIILVIGSLLGLIALVLDIGVGFIRYKFGWKDHKRLQWAIDEKLQLQRLAFEEAGQGRWSGGTDAVPVTSKDEVLGFGLYPDKDHPRLTRSGYYNVRAAEGAGGQDVGVASSEVEKEKAKGVEVTSAETSQLL